MSRSEVTLVALVYKSAEWLNWCMRGVAQAKTDIRYRWLVVANDARDSVISSLAASDFDWVDHRNPDPDEYYINRVYRAWNRGVLEARTQLACLLNSDMWPHDGWLDALIDSKRTMGSVIPTSLLVESGRIPSAMPEYVRDFGVTPDSFDEARFKRHADDLLYTNKDRYSSGRLYMPILVDRQEFFDVGAYPNGNPMGTTGDKDLIRRYNQAGFRHITVNGSIVYHTQEGEMRS